MGHYVVNLFFDILTAIIQWTWVSWYRNVSNLDFIGAKND